jgi:hypothetical protein
MNSFHSKAGLGNMIKNGETHTTVKEESELFFYISCTEVLRCFG